MNVFNKGKYVKVEVLLLFCSETDATCISQNTTELFVCMFRNSGIFHNHCSFI